MVAGHARVTIMSLIRFGGKMLEKKDARMMIFFFSEKQSFPDVLQKRLS